MKPLIATTFKSWKNPKNGTALAKIDSLLLTLSRGHEMDLATSATHRNKVVKVNQLGKVAEFINKGA